jgi:peptidoglycan-associated lipoprotein
MSSSSSSRARTRVTLLASVAVAVLAVGCRRANAPVATSPVIDSPATTPSEPTATPAAQPTAPSTANDESELLRRARMRTTLEQVVYFQLDQSELDASARALLDAKAEILRGDTNYLLRVEGHADERGSDEYNVALAMRRANAVKRYLADRGIPADRLETISFGEERPTCSDANESCWSKNRRAEFAVRGGGS